MPGKFLSKRRIDFTSKIKELLYSFQHRRATHTDMQAIFSVCRRESYHATHIIQGWDLISLDLTLIVRGRSMQISFITYVALVRF